MSNLVKQEFKALDVGGENYLSWQLDAKLHLQAKKLGDSIKEDTNISQENKALALIFLRHHLHDDLKNEYLAEEDPLGLWVALKERYDHQKLIMAPNTHSEWLNLRFQDYESVSKYNSALFSIVSRLRLSGETVSDKQMIEKTLSTFHASSVLLQQQYRERRFTKYSELVTCLLIAEQNNQVLIKNHNARPTGSMAIPEANANYGKKDEKRYPSRRGKYTWKRGGYKNHSRRGGYKGPHGNTRIKNYKKGSSQGNPTKSNKDPSDICHRCGKSGHWSRTCRTPKHVVDQYQASINSVETNLLDSQKLSPHNNIFAENNTHLECDDFFADFDVQPPSNETLAAIGVPQN